VWIDCSFVLKCNRKIDFWIPCVLLVPSLSIFPDLELSVFTR
jgi:hypothetical protein